MYQDKPPLDELMHYGMPRRSGRYPYGSGGEPYQHSGDFLSRVSELKKKGMKETEIVKAMGMRSTDELRTQIGVAKYDQRSLLVATAKGLKNKGLSLNETAKTMGYKNDSSIRSLLNEDSEIQMNQIKVTADFIKKQVDSKGIVDIGVGVESELGIHKEKLKQAVYMLQQQGYEVYGGRVPQVNNAGKKTTLKVIASPGTDHKDIYDYSKIHSLKEYISRDGGDTYEKKFNYPSSMDSKRLKIRYKEEGGIEKDGIIELRRGVDDLSLGKSRYSQVRVLVDKTHYLKGMAVYSDTMPDGVDVIFNTNKPKGTPKHDVMKPIKNDPDNPFGSAIKDTDKGGQYWYTDKSGKKKLGLINKRSDEGDWDEWKDKLPSQFLSKQPKNLAKKQLVLAIDDKVSEYKLISELNNPTVKKLLLKSYADDCDSAAIHLYAAALPRQKYHVIIPITSMKDNEVYAPKYANGEQLALVRYPHGGTFEIPILKVNNRQSTARKLLGTDITDAIGINSKVAERLSGADFDGDTVMCIPMSNKVKIKSTPPLTDLEGFDAKMQYGTKKVGEDYYNQSGHKIKVMKNTQNEMGRISNLITDMTLKGANQNELARAVKHSMVVIDAEKHKLDYKTSYVENGIESLKKSYQGHYDENGKYKTGAATLLSRAKSQESVIKRQGTPKVNIKGTKNYDPSKPEGSLLYKTADDLYYPDRSFNKATGVVKMKSNKGDIEFNISDKKARDKYEPVERVDSITGKVSYTNKDGDIVYRTKMRTDKSTKMAETSNAYSLISDMDTPMERLYADYANRMKSLANQARKETISTGKIEYSKTANGVYKKEVSSLLAKLNEVSKNVPRERHAQTIANSTIDAKKKSNPDMKKEEIKKIGQQELTKARSLVGAKRSIIDVTDKEWEAIQAGAISETKLTQILNRTDIDVIREKATPRSVKSLSTAKVNKMSSMSSMGYTVSEIAKSLGISTTTVSKYLNGKE